MYCNLSVSVWVAVWYRIDVGSGRYVLFRMRTEATVMFSVRVMSTSLYPFFTPPSVGNARARSNCLPMKFGCAVDIFSAAYDVNHTEY